MKTKKVGDRELPASCFAYVGDPENPGTWHLPYLNPDGSPDETHLAAAAAALSEGGFRGQPVDLPAGAAAKVKSKLRAAYQKMGKKMAEMPAQLREAEVPAPAGLGRLIEAVGEGGQEWEVCLIKAGLSKSGTYYPPALLREAAPLFDGVRALIRSDEEHLQDRAVNVNNVGGWYDQPHFVEAERELRARLHMLDHTLGGKMREAWDKGKKDLVGFSIVADGRDSLRRQDGRMVRYAEAITKVDFVDIIVNPSAGGRLVRMINAATSGGNEEMEFLERMIKMIEAERPELLEGKDKDNLKEPEVMALFREAMQGKPVAKDQASGEATDLLKQVETRLKEAEDRHKETLAHFQEAECRNLLSAKLVGCGLPEITQAKLRKEFAARKIFTEAELDQGITEEREYLAKFHEAAGLPGIGAATAGPAEQDKLILGLDGFFFQADQKYKDQRVPRFKSFREAYVAITGDQHVTGRLEDAKKLTRFREALGTDSWAQIFGDSMYRRLLADYNLPQNQTWRLICSDIVPVQDFRENKRLRVGGYGDLPLIDGEHGNYEELTSPADEEVGYSVATRGGLEFLTRRMIINDDVGAIRRIPINLQRAATRTLKKAVFNIFVANPVMSYDSKVLFIDNDHVNLGSTALSQAGLTATRIAMRSQKSYDGNDDLGLIPRYLLVPNELEEMAFELCRSGRKVPASGEATDLPTLHQNLDYLVIDEWTDATDWVAVADPGQIPTIEVGFLQGREEPEIFIQDQPTQGYMFSSDKLAYKIRHEWGVAPLEHRGFYKHVVGS